ncbi:MAG: ribonuclease III domain-containing protein [Erysipelotrichaceae bacterium]|nr:ribonuclease III domain-containing protein [Erysipelotrichaceae bacterium]
MLAEEMSGGVLAFIGDAVMTLMVREYLVSLGYTKAKQLQELSITYVSAKAQAEFMKALSPLLSEEEKIIFRRGRNYKSHSAPRNTDTADYHAATGLEALWGYWHLKHQDARIDEVFQLMIKEKAFQF